MARDDLTPSQLSSIEEIELLRSQLKDALAEIRRLKPAEQQLAEAQDANRQYSEGHKRMTAHIDQLYAQIGDISEAEVLAVRQQRKAEQELAEARALLLRCNDELQPGFGATDDQREQTAKVIRAFLAKGEPHESV